ncbi:syndecan-4 isoform X2 [Corythoichthys intestinalis]|uniref:syndecan-4 isoform X2 n=1 Tax=Corythoichthys intestinalis TaxID=161448 RepID=UPI0025A565CB|nr:syndecan-4 isoform X2 [Corythoichthys intestinalis]
MRGVADLRECVGDIIGVPAAHWRRAARARARGEQKDEQPSDFHGPTENNKSAFRLFCFSNSPSSSCTTFFLSWDSNMSPFGSSAKFLVFVLVALLATFCSQVASESVRETETWMPPKDVHAISSASEHSESSGDFGFADDQDEEEEDDDDDYDDDDYFYYDDDEDNEYEVSGSGHGAGSEPSSPGREVTSPPQGPDMDNKIPEWAGPSPSATDDQDESYAVQNGNEIRRPPSRAGAEPPSNVLMSHAAAGRDDSPARTEVLAALICGGGVGLTLAVLLVLLLLHRMKKKDEGSYELGKKPIYTKAPSAEIYA